MGRVIGSFGIQGWIKVFPETEAIDTLIGYSTWWLGSNNGNWQEMSVTASRVSDRILLVKLKDCADRTDASLLKGMKIAIPRDCLPALPENGENGYYWSDLIGMAVVNLQGEALGTVNALFKTGANDVIQVQSPDTEEKLIPFIDQVVVKVDLRSRQLTVDWGVDY